MQPFRLGACIEFSRVEQAGRAPDRAFCRPLRSPVLASSSVFLALAQLFAVVMLEIVNGSKWLTCTPRFQRRRRT